MRDCATCTPKSVTCWVPVGSVVGQLDLLADVVRHPVAGERFGEFAPLLCEQAEQLDYTDFAVAVAHFRAMADPDGSFNDQAFHENHRTASVIGDWGRGQRARIRW